MAILCVMSDGVQYEMVLRITVRRNFSYTSGFYMINPPLIGTADAA